MVLVSKFQIKRPQDERDGHSPNDMHLALRQADRQTQVPPGNVGAGMETYGAQVVVKAGAKLQETKAGLSELDVESGVA